MMKKALLLLTLNFLAFQAGATQCATLCSASEVSTKPASHCSKHETSDSSTVLDKKGPQFKSSKEGCLGSCDLSSFLKSDQKVEIDIPSVKKAFYSDFLVASIETFQKKVTDKVHIHETYLGPPSVPLFLEIQRLLN